jgi:hypothetical protein
MLSLCRSKWTLTRRLALPLLAVLPGCTDGAAPAAPAVPAEVRPTAGDGQVAPVRTMLALATYDGFENPSLFASAARRDQWVVEPGSTNPVARPVTGHLSDPDAVYDPDSGELRLYYRRWSSPCPTSGPGT